MATKKKAYKKFFVKEADGVYVASSKYFDQITSRPEALALALFTYSEIQTQMLDDYIHDSPAFIGGMKVITGLERTLERFEELFPGLMVEIHSVDRKTFGRRLGRA